MLQLSHFVSPRPHFLHVPEISSNISGLLISLANRVCMVHVQIYSIWLFLSFHCFSDFIFQLVSSACYLVSIHFFAPCVLHPVLQCRQLFSHSVVTRCFCALNHAFLSCDQGAKLPGTFRIMGSFTSLTIRGCVSVGKAVHMLLFTSSFQKPLEFPKMDLTLGLL